jgi:hypothetical protein
MPEGLVALAAGMGGGPIEARAGPAETLPFPAAADATLEFEGVPVREFAPLDAAVASCLVGDFVGDCWLYC